MHIPGSMGIKPSVSLACLLLVWLFVVQTDAVRQSFSKDDALRRALEPVEDEGEIWALLIAGSAGWGNYRHQADVCHAYQVLHHGGIPDERIVVMMADDLALNFENPHPGKIINQPGGPDVYKGVPKDYTGLTVNADNFLRVLAGDPKGPAILGSSGKVIKSTAKDRVFVYYADHGAPGILGMPFGPFLYADQLLNTLRNKSLDNGFVDLVIYVEACESGSMFEGLLDDSLQIYATTAANGQESSWGTYCPGMVPAPPAEYTTCLGDLYSVAWLENSDTADLTQETLHKQFDLIKQRTSNNWTYAQGSHVMNFGNFVIEEEPAADYMGALNTGDGSGNAAASLVPAGRQGAVPQRQADLLHLQVAYEHAPEGPRKAAALERLQAEVAARAAADSDVRRAVAALLSASTLPTLLQESLGSQLDLSALPVADAASPLVEAIVAQLLPRASGLPLVDDWDCLRGMVGAWEGTCGRLTEYSMQYTRTFANLCNAGLPIASLGDVAGQVCIPSAAAQ